jgi:hypothetical protein
MLNARWLPLHLLAMLLLSLAWALSLREQHKAADARQAGEDQARLDSAERMLADKLPAIFTDLRFLSHTGELQAILDERSPAALDRAATLMSALIRDKKRYLGARLFDEQGQLLLRVDRRGADAVRATAQTLQQADGRETFSAAQALPADNVYLSRFELDVDNGQLALPHRPVLRAALPLRRPNRPALVLMLDQDGNALSTTLAAILSTGDAQGMLIDDRGYWLYHPDESLRWGSQLGGGESMARRYPDTWSQIQGARGSRVDDDGHWAYRPIYPLQAVAGAAGPVANRGWWLALRRAPDRHWLIGGLLLSPWFWGAQLLLLLASWLLSLQGAKLERRREREHRALALAEHAADSQRRVREQVYRLSLQAQTADSAETFGQLLLSELAPLLKLSVGALYRLEGQWLRAIAGYGLPESVTLRQFKVGEGLVSEALADHRRLQLQQLPADYLEVRSALGHAAPAQLLVVPLWLRAENLGVLELGLSAPLDEIAQEVLKQSLPLIALHLANYRRRSAEAA